MQNSRNKSKIEIRLSFSEQGTEPLKNRYIFHRRLKYFSKVSCHRPTADPRPGGGAGIEVVLNKS